MLKIFAEVPMLGSVSFGPRRRFATDTHVERSMPVVRVPDRILIVDHDPAARQDIETHLTQRGYEVLTAPNGEEALGILARQKVACMVTDGRPSDTPQGELFS